MGYSTGATHIRARGRWFCLSGALAVAIAVACLTSCNSIERSGLTPGDNAPPFELTSLTEGAQKLSDFRGKVVVLNFWATWCQPCVSELPSLQRLYTDYKSKGLEIVAIGIDDEPSNLEEFRRSYGLSFPILIDRDGSVKSKYKLTGVPETFFLDRDGKITMLVSPLDGRPAIKITGPVDWDAPRAREQLDLLLK